MLDPTKNFGVVSAGSGHNSSTQTVTLATGEGSKLPQPSTDGSFNLVWWNCTDYPNPHSDPFKEIVRVTARAGDVLTVSRGQEGTTATAKQLRSRTYRLALVLTKKTVDDIDDALEDHESRLDELEGAQVTLDPDLEAIAALGGTGWLKRTAADTWALGSPAVADVAGLQTALDAKASTASLGSAAFVAIATFALAVHGHAIADVTGLQAALDAKAAASHTHAVSEVTGLQAALDAKEPALTKGNLTATSPISLSATRQVIGGAVAVSWDFAVANTFTGAQTVRRDAIGATPTDGWVLDNQTAATGSVLQSSPSLRMRGRGWRTNSLASYPVDVRQSVVGHSGLTSDAVWKVDFSINGGAYFNGLCYETRNGGRGLVIATQSGNSNGHPGTTRMVTMENIGSYSWTDYSFNGTVKAAIGASSGGSIYLVSGNNGGGIYLRFGSSIASYSYEHQIFSNGFYVSGYGSFTGRVSAGYGTSTPQNYLQTGGSFGGKGKNWRSSGSLGDEDFVNYIDAAAANVCEGTPSNSCASRSTQGACVANSGCTWTGGDCSAFNGDQSTCTGTSGCTWDSASCSGFGDQGTCEGYGCSWTSCSAYGDESSCSSGGCSWSCSSCSDFNGNEGSCGMTSGCSWDSASCSDFNGDQSACESHSCTWDVLHDCSSFGDEGSCNGASGCSWNGTSCDGGVQYAGTCSGSYYPGTCSGSYNCSCSGDHCSGSYYPGTCSGSWGACSGSASCGAHGSSGACAAEPGCTWATGVSLELPSVADVTANDVGRFYFFKKKTTGTFTLNRKSGTSDTIDGSTSMVISVNEKAVLLHPFVFKAYCSAFDNARSSCLGASGCSWSDACGGYGDESTCNEHGGDGCGWDGSVCYSSTGSCGGEYVTSRQWNKLSDF